MAGPWLPGKGLVTTRVVRSGSSVTTISVDVINAGDASDVAASALVVIATDRPSAAEIDGLPWQQIAEPAVAEALERGYTSYDPIDLTKLGPEFFAHLDIRPVSGFPGANDPRTVTMGWTRFKDAPAATSAWLAACTDMWWPATMTGTNPLRPFATVTFEIMLLVDPTAEPVLNPSEPLLHVGRNVGARGGYVTETAELWAADGRLATTATQLIAVIK
jgi:hypothetical protein